MGLQFNLQAHPRNGGFRLGVRPVLRNNRGKWAKGTLSWNTVSYQANRMHLVPEHHRWFCQFAPLHRATGQVYFAQDNDWLYLDDFSSPLLWPLFDEAARLDIALLGTTKDVTVVVGRQAEISLDVTTIGSAGADLLLAPALSFDGRPHPPEGAGIIGNHGIYGYSAAPTRIILAPLARPVTAEQRTLLERHSAVSIPAVDIDDFMTGLYPQVRQRVTVTSSDDSVHFPAPPPPVLVLTAAFEPADKLRLSWDWDYRYGATSSRKTLLPRPGEPGCRNAVAEARLLELAGAALAAEYPEPENQATVNPAPENPENKAREAESAAARSDESARHGSTLAQLRAQETLLEGIDAAEFSGHMLPTLERLEGLRVDVLGQRPDYRELTGVPQLTISTVESHRRDWFDLGVMVKINGRTIPFAPIFRALAQGKTKLLLVDKTYLSLNQPVFERLHQLIDEARAMQEWDTGLRISRYQASLWADFEDLAEETEPAVSWRAAVGGLLDMAGVEPVPLPSGVHAALRPYQQEGFNWLAFLWRHRLGGILADDMGLGKTLQTLALLAYAKERQAGGDGGRHSNDDGGEGGDRGGGGHLPFLVVAPTSVVSNWVTESRRFTPDLAIVAVADTQGKSRVPLAATVAGADVVVTSYALFRLDFEAYRGLGWSALILDEAQFVKNRAARVHQCARDLDVPFKLAISGTPMENNLMELWALFSIVSPGLFPSARKFTEDYQRPIESGDDSARLAQLRRRIRPLMMRRSKEAVAAELPAKQEQVLEVELGAAQQKIYQTFLQRERQKLFGLIEDLDRNRFIVFRSLTLLRLLSLDASLVDDQYASVPSAKLEALHEQLEDVLAEGHRALIFSQFTSFLKKAAAQLDARGIDYCYLDGSTTQRAEVINRFKAGSVPVFLISLKAGGFGLNLTEADYVFLLDPWWNPAAEAQAVDRTHRIGQQRNVMVYRMIAKDTIEEKVMALKEQKAKLFDAVMDDDAMFSSTLTAEDIKGLLA
ncbi:DEAD/DEAH box helicase [Paenarthrobacter sp. Z7-10]|nr:DEAD/DEAH box helicase [Paenarthrobacter sp. Z7-10]